MRMPLDWIDTVWILTWLYGGVALLMALGVTDMDLCFPPAIGVGLAGPLLRRRYLGPPSPYRKDRSRILGILALLLIGVGSLVLALGGLLLYLRHQDHKPWGPTAIGCLVGLGGLLIGATLDWLQRDHRR